MKQKSPNVSVAITFIQFFAGLVAAVFISGVAAIFNGGFFLFTRPYFSEVVQAWGLPLLLTLGVAFLAWRRRFYTISIGMYVGILLLLPLLLRHL